MEICSALTSVLTSVLTMAKWALMDRSVNTPEKLLHAFRTDNPTAPRLTWYGPDSERVEFSGRVLDNWVAKTANYLVDELDAEPGTVVALHLPLHWRSIVWLLATWAVGAKAVTVPGTTISSTTDAPGADAETDPWAELAANADILATAWPDVAHSHLTGAKSDLLVVAVALPALQMRWMSELPPRTLDYSGDVRSHADVFFADSAADSQDVAWQHHSTGTSECSTTYAALLTPGAELLSVPHIPLPLAPQRVLLHVRDGWDAVVRDALSIWAAGGSIVLLADGVADTPALRASEQITLG